MDFVEDLGAKNCAKSIIFLCFRDHMSYHNDIRYDILFKKKNIKKINSNKVRKKLFFVHTS